MEITVMRRPQIQLERVLAALERELIDAKDEELMEVVDELGLKPSMKGSVALFGVTRRINWAQHVAAAETPSAEGQARTDQSVEKKAPRI
jgi:hypothetical protein